MYMFREKVDRDIDAGSRVSEQNSRGRWVMSHGLGWVAIVFSRENAQPNYDV